MLDVSDIEAHDGGQRPSIAGKTALEVSDVDTDEASGGGCPSPNKCALLDVSNTEAHDGGQRPSIAGKIAFETQQESTHEMHDTTSVGLLLLEAM